MTIHGADALGTRIAELERQLKELLDAHAEVKGRFFAQKEETEQGVKQEDVRFKSHHEERCRRLAEESDGRKRAVEEAHARDLARIEKAFSNAGSRTRSNSSSEDARLVEDRQKTIEKAVSDLKEKNARLLNEHSSGLAEVQDLRGDARVLAKKVGSLAARLRIKVKDQPIALDSIDRLRPDQVVGAAKASLAECERTVAARQKQIWIRFARVSPRFFTLAGLILLLHGAVLIAVREWEPDRFETVLTFIAPVTLLSFLSMAFLFRHWMRQRAHAVLEPLQAGLAEVVALLERRESALRHKEKLNNERFLQLKIDRVSEIEERCRRLDDQAKHFSETRVDILKDQREELIEKAGRRRDRRLSLEAVRQEVQNRDLEHRHASELESRRKPKAERKKEIAAKERAEVEELAGRWKEAIRAFQEAAGQSCRQSRERHPPWTDPRWQSVKMPTAFPDEVLLGNVGFDWSALVGTPEGGIPLPLPADGGASLPLHLGFPGRGNLLMSMDSGTRDAALRALFSTALRILCSFPPGKVKFTIFDPVGLGQNFSAFMHLADYEESLVGGRIWTETSHIERKLAELTEHIEKVIQKYLRNRYASIDEYNREVSEMAEAYRFLVISDFPSGFSDLALERLASILTSGARCGVHTLILWDRGEKLPASMDLARLKSAGLILRATGEGFQIEEEALKKGRLTVEAAPAPEVLTSLFHAIGKQCAAAERVELSFEIVAPRKEGFWTESSESGIRIPLGRVGADRVQYLELGRGTAQHSLIAGKTGSGKSTLFHVMITSSALWYSPRELELYLIDFKKGVEFKTYAMNRLPHARAVAIESDREFGLSVLRRIDRELAARAEQYRKVGVQDFAGYRKAGTADYLPRTLLMIDEFQEFFVEEDGIAQEAALLLDRIVRQGRAFGVHVILGSQTLGGSYTLARTTLGQMAVRIALQCNEADSYLILNDDNAAARLLSRPGEAIYNNMSGMVEGNNPFQVAWLPDEVRDRLLRDVAEKAAEEKAVPLEPTAVFEGNVPADIRNNLLLKERLARPAPPDDETGVSAWIGEANAIKGPTEIRFKNQGGSNLLIVGQQRESAVSVISSAVVSLAAAYPAAGARFIVLDGSPSDLASGRRLSELADVIPHAMKGVEYAGVPEALEDLDAEVNGRLDGSREAKQRIFLIVHDLQRFRQLRQKDEFEFSGGEEKKPSADRHFANILSEGPDQKVHSIVWSDSLNNLNRTLNRKTLGEFQMRVLFQMSGSDSSELIDTPLAGKLGLYRGLLFLEEHGTVEKFRPYSIPDAETVESIRTALRSASLQEKRGPK